VATPGPTQLRRENVTEPASENFVGKPRMKVAAMAFASLLAELPEN